FYGASEDAIAPQVERARKHFMQSGKATYISHEQALECGPLNVAISAFSGIPTAHELGLLKWRPGGGNIWVVPGMPMLGQVAARHHELCRLTLEDRGFEYLAMLVCGARFSRQLIVIAFNREDPDECARAHSADRTMALKFGEEGYSVGRSPTGYQQFHMDT